MTALPSNTRADRPLKRIERQSRHPGTRRILHARIAQHTQKLVQDGPGHPIARRRLGAGIRHRRDAHSARLDIAARRRRQRHIEPTPITTCAGPPASARSSISTPPILRSSKPDVVRPLEHDPARARAPNARDTATPTPRLKAGKALRPLAESPGHRHGDTARRKARSSAGRGGPRPACCSSLKQTSAHAGRRRRAAQAAGYWSSPLRTAAPACAAAPAPRLEFGADAPRIQQFHRVRQTVTRRGSACTSMPQARAGAPRPSTRPRGSRRAASPAIRRSAAAPSASSTSSRG